jgi:hypothetical protein
MQTARWTKCKRTELQLNPLNYHRTKLCLNSTPLKLHFGREPAVPALFNVRWSISSVARVREIDRTPHDSTLVLHSRVKDDPTKYLISRRSTKSMNTKYVFVSIAALCATLISARPSESLGFIRFPSERLDLVADRRRSIDSSERFRIWRVYGRIC